MTTQVTPEGSPLRETIDAPQKASLKKLRLKKKVKRKLFEGGDNGQLLKQAANNMEKRLERQEKNIRKAEMEKDDT